MVEDNKSTGVSGNSTGSSPSSLEKKVKSSSIVMPLLAGVCIVASAVGGYAFARKTQEPIYRDNTVPIHSSIADEIANEKKIEDRVRLEYQPQLDAAKEFQGKYSECMTNLTFEKAKPTMAQGVMADSYYSIIKNNAGDSSSALLSYIQHVKPILAGSLKIKGTSCEEGLSNVYTLMVSPQEAADKATRKLFVDNNRNACRDIGARDQYIVVALINE